MTPSTPSAASTCGRVRVFGLDPYRNRARVRPRTGIMLQEAGFASDVLGATNRHQAVHVARRHGWI